MLLREKFWTFWVFNFDILILFVLILIPLNFVRISQSISCRRFLAFVVRGSKELHSPHDMFVIFWRILSGNYSFVSKQEEMLKKKILKILHICYYLFKTLIRYVNHFLCSSSAGKYWSIHRRACPIHSVEMVAGKNIRFIIKNMFVLL